MLIFTIKCLLRGFAVILIFISNLSCSCPVAQNVFYSGVRKKGKIYEICKNGVYVGQQKLGI